MKDNISWEVLLMKQPETTQPAQCVQPVAPPAVPLLKGVLCNYIPVADMPRAKEWYTRVLGLKPRSPEGGIMIMGSGQWLFLMESKTPGNANFVTDHWEGDNFEMFSLTFETEDIIKLHQSLQANGAEVEPIVDYGGCDLQFRFKDLDGNKFNVWQNSKKS